MTNKKKFDIEYWLHKTEPTIDKTPTQSVTVSTEKKHDIPTNNDVEIIIKRIENSCTDITAQYSDWRNIGFALVDEFGESGRKYYHQISQFYPEYKSSDCDKQYDKCLKANGHGITIKTLFHLAQQAGINLKTTPPAAKNTETNQAPDIQKSISTDIETDDETIFNTPLIPSEIYQQLPTILKESTDMFDDGIEKDVFLIGAITVISGCLPNIEGIYFDEPVSAHLYSFITAPAGSGKGKLKWAKYFGMKIHDKMVESSKEEKDNYAIEIEKYNNLTRTQRQNVERPIQPKTKMFYIPANSSSSAFIQALSDNDFKGVIFETEADTLSETLKQDWGNFSDVLRKAFHHESTNMFRRKDSEYIEIKDPHLAIALSGTPKQITNMIPDVENGLFSRFLYYAFVDYSDFKNPFISYQKVSYTEFFNQKGEEIYELYNTLKDQPKSLEFRFTAKQGQYFTEQFNTHYKQNRMLLGNDFNANSRRLGLITFRIAMVFRALRILEDGDYSNPLICNEPDFQSAINIAFTLEKHAIAVFQNLPNNNLKGIKLKYYKALPDNFNRQDYLSIARGNNIKDKTAEKYIGQFREADLLQHEHNNYTKKVSLNNEQNSK